jgi:hypothetical protein
MNTQKKSTFVVYRKIYVCSVWKHVVPRNRALAALLRESYLTKFPAAQNLHEREFVLAQQESYRIFESILVQEDSQLLELCLMAAWLAVEFDTLNLVPELRLAH